jgi:5S rRNA maturation endonuclease (ribonuclease M5)
MVIRMEERLENLERVVEELVTLNLSVPVVVEGKRDVEALRRLGLVGDIVMTHGRALLALCDDLAERHREIILLVDWDRKGGQIMRTLRENLKGRIGIHDELRRGIAMYAEVRDVESLPGYLTTLRRKVSVTTRDPGRDGAAPSR